MSELIDYGPFLQQLRRYEDFSGWAEVLPAQIDEYYLARNHGDLPRWWQALEALPAVLPTKINLDCSAVGFDAEGVDLEQTRQTLMKLSPWRKGPFDFAGVYIDTEWRSDWKWQRIVGGLDDLRNKRVLDIGCGSGYHCWRMLGAGAELVVGVEPSALFVTQFWALQRYVQDPRISVLPIGIQHLPANLQAFDVTFSMGVLYHRPSPFEHLQELKATLKPGGQLLLETLVIEGGLGEVLVPEGRYASMNNVWFLPSVPTLESWLRKLGFHDIQLVNLDRTSLDEQRSTEWMTYYSLANYLDPDDTRKTIEGHPAPMRAAISARV